MIEAGVLFLVDEQGGSTFTSENMLLKVYCNDVQGNGVQVKWYWRPETVVMMAMKHPEIIVAIDTNSRTYTGKQVINIIIASRHNDYTQV